MSVRMEKSLIVKGPLPDMEDVVRIAAAEGKKLFHTHERIAVKQIFPYENGYVVVVSWNGKGDVRASDVRGKRPKINE